MRVQDFLNELEKKGEFQKQCIVLNKLNRTSDNLQLIQLLRVEVSRHPRGSNPGSMQASHTDYMRATGRGHARRAQGADMCIYLAPGAVPTTISCFPRGAPRALLLPPARLRVPGSYISLPLAVIGAGSSRGEEP